MSTSIYKIEYECDCGVDYGSCGARCAIILKSNNSVDTYVFFHTDSHRYLGNDKDPKTTRGGVDCFGDNYLQALRAVIDLPDSNVNELTEAEKRMVFA